MCNAKRTGTPWHLQKIDADLARVESFIRSWGMSAGDAALVKARLWDRVAVYQAAGFVDDVALGRAMEDCSIR